MKKTFFFSVVLLCCSFLLFCAGPGSAQTITITPDSIAYTGCTGVGSPSYTDSFSMSGAYLTPASGTLTVTAPTGFRVSATGTLWVTSFSVSYTGATLGATEVYIQFDPTWGTSYSGSVSITGGGTSGVSGVYVSGAGCTGCSGTPTAGIVNDVTGGTFCPSSSDTLFLVGTTAATGLTYQWQMFTGTWTNIAGATNPTYPFTETATTLFQCIVTCAATGDSSFSSDETIDYVSGCYCIPSFTYPGPSCSSYNYALHSLYIGVGPYTLFADTVSCDGSGYNNRGFAMAVDMGVTYLATIISNTAGTTPYGLNNQIWIDFNDNGTFESSEIVGGANNYGDTSIPAVAVDTVFIPATAPGGTHRLRIVQVPASSGVAYPSISPCPSGAHPYEYGDSRDYVIAISECTYLGMTGPTSVCVGSTIALSDTVIGGTWAGSAWWTSDTTIATVSPAGVVTGVAPGTFTIYYGGWGTCHGGASSTITVRPLTHGVVSGPSSIAAGDTTTYTDSLSGGAWSSSNTTVAIIDSSTGLLTALTAGTTTLTYTFTDSCGISYDTMTVTVSAINRISGNINFGSTPIDTTGSLKVWLITYNSSTLDLEAADSTFPALHSGSTAYYEFSGAAADSYRVKAAYFPPTFDSIGYTPTYHTSSLHWGTANVFAHSTTVANDHTDINMIYGTATTGPGFIGGLVTSGAGRGTAGSGVPVAGLLVFCVNTSTGALVQSTYTTSTGNYSFGNLPVGASYMIYPEAINYATTPYASISLTTAAPAVSNADFIKHTVSRTITPNALSTTTLVEQVPSILVFPNPAFDKINLQYFGNTAEKGTVTITDMAGRKVYSADINLVKGSGNKTLDVSALDAGVYMVEVKAGEMVRVEKVEVRK